MANIKQQKKRNRLAVKQRLRNRHTKSTLKTLFKQLETEVAEKKATRELHAGIVSAYVHSNSKVGALVQVHVETDFVAKNEGFKTLAEDIAMHVTAMNPADIAELLTQPFIKDPSLTIDELIKNHTQKFGERIEVVGL